MPLVGVKPSLKLPQGAAQSAIFRTITTPSPNKGLDLSTPLTDQDPRSAVVLDNFLCRRIGIELRRGSLRWATNLGGQVVSVMSYNSSGVGGSANTPHLFAACDDGKIYDITNTTNESSTPPVSVTIPGQLNPGRFSWVNFSTSGTTYLCIAGAGAGYWTFDHVNGWTNRTGNITPGSVPAINFDFVMSWKNRLWFIVINTADAYYLTTAAIQGSAAKFDFGPMLVHGGDLAAMASWTLDAGDGIDDKLVLVGHSGDVLVYQGTDPATAATFGIVGRWYTGRPPLGRRFMSKYGGDLYMITELGIEYMANLIQGQGLLDKIEGSRDDPARRFNETLGADVRATRGEFFWSMIYATGEQGIVVQTPFYQRVRAHQYFFGLLSHGWSRITGWLATAFENHLGEIFYGTEDGKICKAFTGTTDDALSDGTLGVSPAWELQSAFVAPNGDNVALKIPQLVRVMFQGPEAPDIKLKINTEWDTTPVAGAPPSILTDVARWDVGKWDISRWGADVNAYSTWVGAEGLGVYFSLRMSVRGAPGTLFNSWSVTYTTGGVM